MGREVRRVPPTWDHPRNNHGKYIPLLSAADAEMLRSDGSPIEESRVMPNWSDAEATHYQMYETCTEGTPISPVKSTPEELADWLHTNLASAFGSMTASYESWLRVARGSWAPSAVIAGGVVKSRVDGVKG